MGRRLFFALFVLLAFAAPALAQAQCIDINADPEQELVGIVHIDEERAEQIVASRPWQGVRALTGVYGIGHGARPCAGRSGGCGRWDVAGEFVPPWEFRQRH